MLQLLTLLRLHKIPVSIGEWLDFMGALKANLVVTNPEGLYGLAQLCLVKHERHFSQFDRAFEAWLALDPRSEGVFLDEALQAALLEVLGSHRATFEARQVLEADLRRYVELVAAEKIGFENMGLDGSLLPKDLGIRQLPWREHKFEPDAEGEFDVAADDPMQGSHGLPEPVAGDNQSNLVQGNSPGLRSEEPYPSDEFDEDHGGESDEPGQKGQGGEAGVGASDQLGQGFAETLPRVTGVRSQVTAQRFSTAAKVALMDQFDGLEDDARLGVRSMRMAIRRLRQWVRAAQTEELDLSSTLKATATNGGWLDIRMQPSRVNGLKLVLLLDSGGSMEAHAELCHQLFTAVKSELRSLTALTFHNCIYAELAPMASAGAPSPLRIATMDFLAKLDRDTRIVVVGDGQMGLQELLEVGGSLTHFNAITGLEWLQRVEQRCRHVAWLNPLPTETWAGSSSITLIKETFADRMYSLTHAGLADASQALMR